MSKFLNEILLNNDTYHSYKGIALKLKNVRCENKTNKKERKIVSCI